MTGAHYYTGREGLLKICAVYPAGGLTLFPLAFGGA